MAIVLQSTLTCPHCDAQKTETMPADACVYFWRCPACQALLKPKPGDCCVFCSYGTVKCPPVQAGTPCGGGGEAAAGCCESPGPA